jgi:(1->4)-alpha-D-glucan 1-alpha-D-glucosylmutase
VDFDARQAALAALETPDWSALVKSWPDGRLKLAWTRHLLRLRSELDGVFTDGDYQPLEVRGARADHIVAFVRRRGRSAAIVAVARQFAPFTKAGREWPTFDDFEATIDLTGYSVPGLAGNELPLARAFRDGPAAVIAARTTTAAKAARQRLRA